VTADGSLAPRALRDPAEVARRRAMLGEPHVAPLAAFADALRDRGEVPDADPLDGGVCARLLLLLEKPGPKTSPARGGSGFVSADNDDPTAEAGWRFAREAEIARCDRLVWNTVPWWNGTIRFTAAERRAGLEALPGFLDLLPALRAVVLVGRQAGRARGLVEARGLQVFESAHPSPQVRAANPDRWHAIPARWAEARATLVGAAIRP
jgi:hypothetical protein